MLFKREYIVVEVLVRVERSTLRLFVRPAANSIAWAPMEGRGAEKAAATKGPCVATAWHVSRLLSEGPHEASAV